MVQIMVPLQVEALEVIEVHMEQKILVVELQQKLLSYL
tara:strand:- start:405 stop:518 length:114 start_codon:yes stop_codon:yes gene_type:complete